MNLPRPTRTTAILSLCLALLAGILCYEHHQLSQLRRVMRRLPEPPDVLAPHPRPRWRLAQLEPLRVEVPERHRCRRRDLRNSLRPLRIRLAQPRLRDDAVVVGMVGVDEDGDGDAVLFRPSQKTLERLEALEEKMWDDLNS